MGRAAEASERFATGESPEVRDFRLDATNECLWQGFQAIALRPKAFAVLKHLVDRRGQLVTKQQLLEAVWPGTFVSDAVLKDSIRQLREALGDDAASPRYIETAHRRGYRFIGQTEEAGGSPRLGSSGPVVAMPTLSVSAVRRSWPRCGAGSTSAGGERQVVFVTGEAGIGKTTLVNAFLDRPRRPHEAGVARGQCLEQYGAGEAYLPVLDALLATWAVPPAETGSLAVLRRHAPAWLAELPSLISDRSSEPLPAARGRRDARTHAARDGRGLEAMSGVAPFILVLEICIGATFRRSIWSILARRGDAAR